MVKVEQPLGIISVFIWVGMIIAISFMEAWLKFRAPGVTLPIGLGIGRLVFGALNRVEWILAVVVTAGMLFGKKKYCAAVPHLRCADSACASNILAAACARQEGGNIYQRANARSIVFAHLFCCR